MDSKIWPSSQSLRVNVIVWLIVTMAFVLFGGASISELRLTDPDNYLRMLQALRWLDGASWYDMTQPRMDPPLGVEMHW